MRCAVLALVLLVSMSTTYGSGRDDEPVTLDVARLVDLSGTAIPAVALFRYDPSSSGFVPIPFQFDERLDRVFNVGTEFEFTEVGMYDVLGEEDGILDDDDQLVFMFRDGGTQRAPAQAPWPTGAGADRWEIEVLDPRPGVNSPPRWVYLYEGTALPLSNVRYVDWNGLADASITSSRFRLDYTGNWLLTGIAVLPPCGDGVDLIDRLKGRARTVGTLTEDEENWSANSTFLGAKVGPVRAIRYVRGATSGVNTIYYDLVYDTFVSRTVNLRVHPLQEIWFYADWRLDSSLTLFTPTKRSGLKVDGLNDAGVSSSWADWTVMRGPRGGLLSLFDVPDSVLYQDKQFYYRDDASYNDQVPLNPEYGDEDDRAIGDHGLRVVGLRDSQINAIVLRIRMYPLCRAEGDASWGDLYRQLADTPLDADAYRQDRGLVAVRALRVGRNGNDAVLSWETQAAATSYRIYAAGSPNLPHASWTLLAEVSTNTFTDPAGTLFGALQVYSVVPVAAGIEGPW
ncbi:MAG: hypothetical protein U0V87_07390 [Acidobacteriota bacterium]